MEMLASRRLMQRKATLTKRPSSQALPESDKRFHFHRKQDAKDTTQLVSGDDTVFIRLVDYVVDGQLAYVAGGPPSKPLEWMVSNPLLPNPSTVAMQGQDGFGRYW